MRKLLVLRGGALGDFLVTLPALARLRRAWPAARIELAGNAPAAALARDAGLIDVAYSQNESRWAALFAAVPALAPASTAEPESRPAPLPAEFAAWLATFDLVVNFWPDADGALARHFPRHAGQTFLSAPALPAIAPAAAHYYEALRPLGLDTAETPTAENYFFRLHPIDTAAATATAGATGRARAPLALHPGSGSPAKNWPLDRWAALCARLRDERGEDLLIITGEAEADAARALARFGTPAHALPLGELAARLARCRLFVGHDSGVSHLAAACGVPSVLLFGPTDPVMWAPPASHVRVLRSGADLGNISAAEVQRAVAQAIA